MNAKILGKKERKIGVEVIDNSDHTHTVEIGLGGEIEHFVDAYPHDPADRTDEEELTMLRVQERAKYEAHQEFPDANLVEPMWLPEHLDRGVEAVVNYPLDEFTQEFRDYYDALRDPSAFVDDPDDAIIYQPFGIDENNRITEVYDVVIRYTARLGGTEQYNSFPDIDDSNLIVCALPNIQFDPGFSFEEDFPGLITGHLMAQIRDIYRHMGEQPPEEYRVSGIGKTDYHGGDFSDNV